MTSSSTTSVDLTMVTFANGTRRMSVNTLKEILPTTELALFFAKVYDLTYEELSKLLATLFHTTVVDALMAGNHSLDLQGYIVETVPQSVLDQTNPHFTAEEPVPGEVLPELWNYLEVKIAESIQEVADTLLDVFDTMPGMEGHMAFSHLADFNVQYNQMGVFDAQVKHSHDAPNLVILDDSGSMREETIAAILGDVVSLAWKANAHLALVSNTCRVWEPGAFDVPTVLSQGEYGGTHYETLIPLLQRDWGTVVTIADYDSSRSARDAIAGNASGRIARVLDISLVNRSSYLAECVGQLADEVRPLLIANNRYGF